MRKGHSTGKSRTNWNRLRTSGDKDVNESDIPQVTPQEFARAIVRKGLVPIPPKRQITLRIDGDVLDWFRRQGPGYQTQINALLRAYVDAHKE